MTEPENFFIWSYAPLVNPVEVGLDKFYDPSMIPVVLAYYNSLPNGEAKSVAWVMHQDQLAPIFVMPRAREIATHMKEWAENDVKGWFEVSMAVIGRAYRIVLLPSIDRTVERQRFRYKMTMMRDLPEGAQFKLIFHPISFMAVDSETIIKVRKNLPKDEIMVGFMDLEALNSGNFEDDQVIWLGPLKVGPKQPAKEDLKRLLKDHNELS